MSGQSLLKFSPTPLNAIHKSYPRQLTRLQSLNYSASSRVRIKSFITQPLSAKSTSRECYVRLAIVLTHDPETIDTYYGAGCANRTFSFTFSSFSVLSFLFPYSNLVNCCLICFILRRKYVDHRQFTCVWLKICKRKAASEI